MPCPHNEITIVQRSQRQSAVAAAAYQSGEKLFCEYDQQVKHYPEKRGIVHNEILLPPNAPQEYADRNTLWNAAEAVEKQWNSQLARRWVLTIPREIPPDQYAVLVREFCEQQFVSKGMIADFAIHDPHPPGHNPHAHVMLTMRAMDEHGKWLPKSRKVYDLDESGERIKLPSGRWKSHKEDLNDFDWYVGRMYMEPHRQCKHKGNDTRRLKWAGVTPKYNYRYADDWVILTSTEKEALRLKRVLTKYFRNRMKLELSQEKTYVTDLRTNGIHFLGFVVKAERKRKTPDPATWTKHLVGKPLPDMERLGKKIKKLLEEVHRIELCQKVNVQAAQIQYVNSVIMGMAQYLQTSICSHAYHAIDRRVNNAALTVWKKLYPKRYNSMQVPLKVLCNLPDRHKGYDSKTFAVWVEGKWFGITYAFITHSHYEPKPFDQKMTPYTVEGRRRYVSYRAKHKPLPCDRPSVNSPNDIAMSAYAKGRMNFEYYMNREYAYSRDKGKCKCCGNAFSPVLQKHCHHVKNKLPLDRINKVPNLVWLCEPCHRMVHNSPIPSELDAKTVGKIMKYREKLKL